MKKFILLALFFAATAFVTLNAVRRDITSKDKLLAANIEALAEGESGSQGESVNPWDVETLKPSEGFQATIVRTERWDVKLNMKVVEVSTQCLKVNVMVSCSIYF